MEVSAQPTSSLGNFGHQYGSYESGATASYGSNASSSGIFETEQYDYSDDHNMHFEGDYESTTGVSSCSSASDVFSIDMDTDTPSESDDDDSQMEEAMETDEMEISDDTRLHTQSDVLEMAAATEMLRIRFPYQSITIRLADFCCLQEKDLLNDTIVDFYLNHIVEHILPDDPLKRVTVLPSLFWHNLSILHAAQTEIQFGLIQDDKEAEAEKQSPVERNLTARQQLDARFSDVLEFVEGFDLLDVDYIVIPVNEWEHWSLVVVCNPFTERGRIVCFDSQLTDDHNNLQNIATLVDDFLKYAWLRWRGEESPFSLPCVIPRNMAQQTNNFDCGVFIIEFARHFLTQPVNDLDDFDFAAAYEEFNMKTARQNMQRTVLSLCSNRSLWSPLLDLINGQTTQN